jgi:hypothetical protein
LRQSGTNQQDGTNGVTECEENHADGLRSC